MEQLSTKDTIKRIFKGVMVYTVLTVLTKVCRVLSRQYSYCKVENQQEATKILFCLFSSNMSMATIYIYFHFDSLYSHVQYMFIFYNSKVYSAFLYLYLFPDSLQTCAIFT